MSGYIFDSSTYACSFTPRFVRFSKTDHLTYNNDLESVSSFAYLGVVFQTMGRVHGHVDNLKSKGIASSTVRFHKYMTLCQMSVINTLRKLAIPSPTYGMRTRSRQLIDT